MPAPHPAPAGESVAPVTDPTDPTAPVDTAELPVHGPVPPPPGALDTLFPHWSEVGRARRTRHPRLVAAAVALSGLAAWTLPGRPYGLGLALVILLGAAVAAAPVRRRASADTRAHAVLFVALVSVVVLRDARWIVEFCLLSAFVVAAAALAGPRTVTGLVRSSFAVPLAWLRGLGWLARSVGRGGPGPRRPTGAVLRTVLVSVVLLAVFASLFASADLVFAGWVRLLTPRLPALPAEALGVFLATAGLVLGGTYVGVNPPQVDRPARASSRTTHRFEWVTPVVVVIVVFAAFLSAQLSVLFGGHSYLQRTSGVTYADYVHQGFGQLTVASAIVLGLVGIVLRAAPRDDRTDRRLVRLLVGTLGALSLVVVASALYRLQVYEAAYGFTRLRLLVGVFEAWLGLVLLLATTVGVWLRAGWLPRAAVLAGVVIIFGLAVADPDAMIAEHNVRRYETTGRIDVAYLRSLSADAVPALDRLPEPLRSCGLGFTDVQPATGLDGNLGRHRALIVLRSHPARMADCR